MPDLRPLDSLSRPRSPAAAPDYLAGRPSRNKGRRYAAGTMAVTLGKEWGDVAFRVGPAAATGGGHRHHHAPVGMDDDAQAT